MDNIENSEEPVYEIRGKGNTWKIYYPDEGDNATPFPFYDKEGKLKTVIYAGGTSGRLTELNEQFSSANEAEEYAKKMGAENIKIFTTKERKKKDA